MKKIILSALALAMLASSSCKKNADDQNPEVLNSKAKAIAKVCVDKQPLASLGSPSTEGILVKQYKWANGKTIKVKFLNGSTFLQSKVKQFAKIWEQYANIKFDFVASNAAADIKVGFKLNGDEGSWSVYGTEALNESQSMNFGWFDANTSDDDFSSTVLHEFGHALGLAHEQFSPNQNIQWDKPAVYDYFAGAPNYWDKATVEFNIFQKFKKNDSSISYTAYDSLSIMQYYIDPSWTLDGFSVDENIVLSAKDKTFIASVYPK